MEKFKACLVMVLSFLDALGEKVVSRFIDDFLSVAFLICDPAHDLLLFLSRQRPATCERAYLAARFCNCRHMLLEFAEFEFVAVDTAGHLAMSTSEIGDKK